MKRFATLLSAFLMICSFCFAEIVESYKELFKNLLNSQSTHEAIRAIYPDWIRSQKACDVIPLEATIPSLIAKWQKQGISMMGFTHRQVPICFATSDQLQRIGIDLSLTAPHQLQLDLAGFESTPRFVEGILFVNDYNEKGEVIFTFLKTIGHFPSKVVFVDDGLRHLISVEQALKPLGIEVICLHSCLYAKRGKMCHSEIAEVQKSTYGRILSDEEARFLMQ